MEQTERSETSAYKIQMPGNYPEESIQHLEHRESLKSRRSRMSPELHLFPFFWLVRCNTCLSICEY